MLRWFALVAVLFLPGAQACVAAAPVDLALDFDKKGCKRGNLDACPALPEADVPFEVEGVLTWSWQLDPACGVVLPTESAVHIHLSGLERQNEGWLQLTSDPAEIYIDPVAQWDLTDDAVDPVAGRYQARESYLIKVTVTLVGEPSPEALERLDARDGMVILDLRASADAVGSYDPLSSLETFSFDGRPLLEPAADGARSALDVPGITPALALLAVALAGLLRRSD